jgi:putative FmdB family regulatory protein
MPIYEYQCEACECQFETLVFGGDDSGVTCPSCCATKVKKLISAGAIRPQGIPSGGGGFQAPACKPRAGG